MFSLTEFEIQLETTVPSALDCSRTYGEATWRYILGADLASDNDALGSVDKSTVRKLEGLIPGIIHSDALIIEEGILDGSLFPSITEASARVEVKERLLKLGARIQSEESRLADVHFWLSFEVIFVDIASMFGKKSYGKTLFTILQDNWTRKKTMALDLPAGITKCKPTGISESEMLRTLFVQLQLHIVRNSDALLKIYHTALPHRWVDNCDNKDVVKYCLRFAAVPEWRKMYDLLLAMGFKPSCNGHPKFSTSIIESVYSNAEILVAHLSPDKEDEKKAKKWAARTLTTLRNDMAKVDRLHRNLSMTTGSRSDTTSAIGVVWDRYSAEIRHNLYLKRISGKASRIPDCFEDDEDLWSAWVRVKEFIRTFILGLGKNTEEAFKDLVLGDCDGWPQPSTTFPITSPQVRNEYREDMEVSLEAEMVKTMEASGAGLDPEMIKALGIQVEMEVLKPPRGNELYKKRRAAALARGNVMEDTLNRQLDIASGKREHIREDSEGIIMD